MANLVRTSAVLGALALSLPPNLPAQPPQARVAGRWLGQGRTDKVGGQGEIGPNGVQDVKIALGGLPRLEITEITVKGHGADQWLFPIAKNLSQFAALLDRQPGSPTAEISFEPLRVEVGREFYVKLKFADGRETETFLKGGKADPNLRMPGQGIAAKWSGQGPLDFTGADAGVGPDGYQDARIDLERLSKADKVKAVILESADGGAWASGLNPDLHHNAEFGVNPQDPGRGSLYFQPDRDLARKRLSLTVVYENGKTDSTDLVAPKTVAHLAMPKVSLPRLTPVKVNARWHGQDGSREVGPGAVHVAVAGLPTDRKLSAAVLSDGVRSAWVYRASDRVSLDMEPATRPLVVRKGKAPGVIDLFFRPYRNLDGQALTLRFVFHDDSQTFTTIAGGPADPALTAPSPDPSSVTAKPGDDLQNLVNRFGTVRLSPGVYPLSRPLVLPRPVQLLGDHGAVLEFRQGAADPLWTAAIKIHQGGTKLSGFATRFVGPVRWRTDVGWGPALIGTTDNLDKLPPLDKPNLVFEGLELTVPPSSKTQGWEEAPKILRLLDATSGRIANNKLVGGPVEFFGGPWVVEGNTFLGTPANTFSPVVFAAHKPHDLIVRNNRAQPNALGGKTWRFLLLTNRGHGDIIEGNVVEGIGPRDDDAIPPMNSPEIFLTESYHVRFEGRAAAVSPDGRLVKVARLRGEAPVTGDIVSVLSGKEAGAWRKIAQRIDPTTYLLASPLPEGSDVLSITPGFVNEVYDKNSVNARGGRAAAGFVLAGNHYGTKVTNNSVVGAGDAYQIMAYPSEAPVQWGWTHAPYLDGLFANNVVEDSERGAQIGVLHNGNDKSSKKRTFMTIALKGNLVKWSDAFVARTPVSPPKGQAFLPGINLGWLPSRDPLELVATLEGDRLVGRSGPALRVNGAILNGGKVVGKDFTLPLPSIASAAVGNASPSRSTPRR